MKILFMIILLLGFIALGIYVYYSYISRVKIFEDMIHISCFLQNNISFNKCELNVIINNCYDELHNVTKAYLNNAKKIIPQLKQSDKKLIDNFFCSLGTGDVRYELDNLKFYENSFKERLDFHKENQKNGSLYLKLIIGLGLMICIILI